jgi:large subunit ribosomal protein L6
MSKIGRKAIELGALNVAINGHDISFKGSKVAGTYHLPTELEARLEGTKLFIVGRKDASLKLRELNRVWGLHRCLLANEIKGAQAPFERKMEINGLGYKAIVAGNKVTFHLGYSHKIDFELPQGITAEVDKTGQKMVVKGVDKRIVGLVCSKIRALRKPEPYKGKGIKLEDEVILRKAGKTKS